MSPQYFYLRIIAWEKHQKDRTYIWFKLRNDVFSDPKFHSLSLKAKIVFIYALSTCARVGSATVQLEYGLIARSIPLRVNFVQSAIRELEENQMVKSVSSTDAVPRREEKEEKIPNHRFTSSDQTRNNQKTTAEQLVDLWNQKRGLLPVAHKLSPSRTRKANQRLNEEPDLAKWAEVIIALSKSDFHCGKNDRGWKANFDYLIKPDTFLKVLEGIATSPKNFGLVDEL